MLSMTNDFFFASFDKKSSFSPAKCVNSVMFTIFTFKVLCFFHLFCKQYTYTSNFSSNTMFMSTSFGTKQQKCCIDFTVHISSHTDLKRSLFFNHSRSHTHTHAPHTHTLTHHTHTHTPATYVHTICYSSYILFITICY